MERRLAAILVADVAGYTRLMERDEPGTMATLADRRKTVWEPLLAKYNGRVIRTKGDSTLAEFASAVAAVRCAVDVQRAMKAANAQVSGDRAIVLRIGLNLGDVMVEDGDLFGDGVNVAARLEAMAEPGAICLSGAVHQQVERLVSFSFKDLGDQTLKHIARPVRVYCVADDQEAEGDVSHVRSPTNQTSLPSSKPSIAVLPFTNMSGDADQQYFSDGITEDIITELSRFHSLFVIARNSSFQYRDKAVDVKRIGRDLGVQYVVEGSVRKTGTQFRITAQLVDATAGSHLWASRYDRKLEDIFATQDEVTTEIASVVVGRVHAAGIDGARRKHTTSLAAYDYFLRGLEHFNRAGSDDTVPAREMFERAIALDPTFAQGHALLAMTLTEAFIADKWTMPEQEVTAALDRFLMHAQRSVDLDANDALCHCALACSHLFRKSFGLAVDHFDLALQLNPNDPDIRVYRGLLDMFMGQPQHALDVLDTALKHNPTPPNWYREIQGMIFYALRRYEEAAGAWERTTAKRPYVYRYLAACYMELGDTEKAQVLVAHALRLQPHFSLRLWAELEPYLHRHDLEHMLGGMRKAGLPE